MHRATSLAVASALAVTFSWMGAARATEHEWHLGASGGLAIVDFPRGLARDGFGGGLHARYGLTDAIDFAMNATLFGFPDDTRLSWGTNVAVDYVVDVSRWIPTLGVSFGVVDLVGLGCETDPYRCGHIFMPAIGLPASLEFRVVPNVPLGIRFEYQFLILGGPSSQMFVGFYGAFAR